MGKLIYDGDSVYELDEECLRKREEQERRKEMEWQQRRAGSSDKRTDSFAEK